MDEWSGVNEGWRREAFYVTPGYKTFKWVYTKNGSTNGGTDRGWLDNIMLPPAMCLTLWAGPDIIICPGETSLGSRNPTGPVLQPLNGHHQALVLSMTIPRSSRFISQVMKILPIKV